MIKISALIIAAVIIVNISFAQTTKIDVVGTDSSGLFDSQLEDPDTSPNNRPDYQAESIPKRLSLTEALEQGLRKNYKQKIRNFTFEILDLDYANDYDSFWFPKVSLVMNSNPSLVEKVYTDNSMGQGTGKTPGGYVGLEFSDFTVFNWGRDYLEFLNQKTTYTRAKQRLNEQRRQLRFNIIGQYFQVAMAKVILHSRAEILRHSSFIYRLAQEKMALKKTTSQELLQAKEEYLRAMGEHREYLYKVLQEEQILAGFLGDDITTNYKITNELKFKSLSTNKEEAYKFATQTSPQLLQARVNLSNATRSFQKTLKDNLPLPRISMRLGAYRHGFSSAGVEDTYSTSDAINNKNVELAASINMSWTLFGDGGFLNSRTKESSYLNKRISEAELTEVKRDLHVTIASLIRRINFVERRVESSEKRLKNARRTFDKTLDNYIGSKTAFINVKTVLTSLRDAEYEYEESKLNHLVYKLQLAALMGVENFPGQNFEQLVIR